MYLTKRNEKEVMDELFQEMKSGVIKDFDEMQRRKAELLNEPIGKNKVVIEGRGNASSGLLSKVILIAIFIIIAVFLINFKGFRASVSQESYNGLNAEDDPLQSGTSVGEFFATYEKTEWKITPLADYRLVAKVQSKHHISSQQDGAAAIGSYDLALAWGKLVDSQFDKYIKYRQSGRKFYFNYSADCPLSESYISEHAANTHIIAATETVLEGIKYIKKGDIVYMEGHLVNVFTKGEKGDYTWNTSLVRNDNSNNSGCEIFYVKKLQIGSKTFE